MRSWRTTIAGFVAAVANLIQNGLSWKSALLSAAIATVGALAKDYSVSGK